MSSTSVSLDMNYEKKMEKIRDKYYPDLTIGQAIQAFLKDCLDGKVMKIDKGAST